MSAGGPAQRPDDAGRVSAGPEWRRDLTVASRAFRLPIRSDRMPMSPPGPAELAPGWSSELGRVVPYVFAVTTAVQLVAVLAYQPLQIGFDARLYAAAARAWLTGGDPWQVSDQGVFFAAPPPSLVLSAPFAFLPPELTTVVSVVGLVAIAWAALRSLGAPMWWLLWWPLVSGCMVGSADVAVLGLLVIASGRLAWIAPLAKIYAFAPIVAERRWRAVIYAAIALVVTAPLLPWRQFLDAGPVVVDHLRSVAATTSVFGSPILMGIAVIALLSLGIRRAGWLAVPVLWPYTQPHYLAPSVPALSPVLAIAWSFPHPLIVLAGIVTEAVLRSPIPRTLRARR